MNTRLLTLAFVVTQFALSPASRAALATIDDVAWQPFAAQIRRVIDTLESVGEPLQPEDRKTLQQLLASDGAGDASSRAQEILDKYCIAGVQINPRVAGEGGHRRCQT